MPTGKCTNCLAYNFDCTYNEVRIALLVAIVSLLLTRHESPVAPHRLPRSEARPKGLAASLRRFQSVC